MKIPKQFYSIKGNALFVLFLTVFCILFAVLYAPSYGYDTTYWRMHDGLLVPILAAIVLVTVSISRTALLLLTGTNRLHSREYLVWLALEWLVSCLFCDLFLCLYMHRGFFEILLQVLLIGLSVGIFPYVFYWIYTELQATADNLRDAHETIDNLRQGMEHIEEVVQFFDEKNSAKLMVELSTIYSVESAGNYVNVVYDDNGKLQRYSLRNSMKGVEATCEKHGLVRCHRSYFINPRKIKLIRKESGGAFAEIQCASVSDIPISPRYLAEVAQQFSLL